MQAIWGYQSVCMCFHCAQHNEILILITGYHRKNTTIATPSTESEALFYIWLLEGEPHQSRFSEQAEWSNAENKIAC